MVHLNSEAQELLTFDEQELCAKEAQMIRDLVKKQEQQANLIRKKMEKLKNELESDKNNTNGS